MNIDLIQQRAKKAKPDGSGAVTRNRYDHGGGRMYQENGSGVRDLIADLYEEDSREFYFYARDDVLALCERVKELEARLSDRA